MTRIKLKELIKNLEVKKHTCICSEKKVIKKYLIYLYDRWNKINDRIIERKEMIKNVKTSDNEKV